MEIRTTDILRPRDKMGEHFHRAQLKHHSTARRVAIAGVPLAIALFCTGALPEDARADEKFWLCGTDGWNNGSCWDTPGQPNTGDNAYLLQSGSNDYSVSYINTLYPAAVINNLTIDATGSGNMTLLQSQDTLTVGSQYVGLNGTGALVQTSGTNTGRTYIGYNSTSSGSYDLIGGSRNGNLQLGYAGMGEFNQTGGTNDAGFSSIILGMQTTGNGTYNLHAGTVFAESTYVGYNGVGTFTQDGGTHANGNAGTAGATLQVGVAASGTGTYNLVNGTLGGQGTSIGVYGTGTMNQSGGDHVLMGGDSSNWGLTVGDSTTGIGTYNLSGGTIATLREYVGRNGTGTFTQTGGTNTISIDSGNMDYGLYLGYGSTGHGTYNLVNGTLGSYHMTVGRNGTGVFNQSGGVADISEYYGGPRPASAGYEALIGGKLWLGDQASGQGTYNLSGGSLTTSNAVVGVSGNGEFNQSGGTHTVNDTLTLAQNAGSIGVYTLSGGLLDVINVIVNTGGTFNLNGGVLDVDTFTGNLINNGGTIAPGSSPGTTNIFGDYSQLAGTYAVEIAGTGPGEYDLLNVSGTATLGGILDVSFFDAGGGLFNAQLGDSFDILFAEDIIGEFDLLTLAVLDDGLRWQVSYLADALGTLDLVRLSVAAVPLPTAVWLFASGLLGLVSVARRRSSR